MPEIARRDGWKTKSLPRECVGLSIDRTYTKDEFENIRAGFIPECMEDKWFIFYEDGSLWFHRSWTGFCIYRVRFQEEDSGARTVFVQVNRNPTQYKAMDDEVDARQVLFIIDRLLLGRDSLPPWSCTGQQDAVRLWTTLGRNIYCPGHQDEEDS